MTELIIFDCDGTLVDSELLYNSVISEMLLEAGLEEYTPSKCLDIFTGLTFTDIRQQVEKAHRKNLGHFMTSEQYVERCFKSLNQDVQSIEGASDLLHMIKDRYKICVGSNGERKSVIRSLQLTGLYDFFGGHDDNIFTKIQVKNAKPAPDLFLFAAEQMGVSPENCVVVEDSVAGVQAGVSAGMHVLGFTGSHHNPESQSETLRQAGAHQTIDQLIHITDYMQEQKRFAS